MGLKESVERVSSLNGDDRPCDGAVQASDGDWYVELGSLEELIELTRNVDGRIIVYAYPGTEAYLTIYDYHIE